MFSAGLWGLDSSGGDDEDVVCWRQNSWNSVMITLLLLILPCSRGSNWPSTGGERAWHSVQRRSIWTGMTVTVCTSAKSQEKQHSANQLRVKTTLTFHLSTTWCKPAYRNVHWPVNITVMNDSSHCKVVVWLQHIHSSWCKDNGTLLKLCHHIHSCPSKPCGTHLHCASLSCFWDWSSGLRLVSALGKGSTMHTAKGCRRSKPGPSPSHTQPLTTGSSTFIFFLVDISSSHSLAFSFWRNFCFSRSPPSWDIRRELTVVQKQEAFGNKKIQTPLSD